MTDDEDIPKSGDVLSVQDIEMIAEAVLERQENFRDEPVDVSLCVVLSNIGDRFAQVSCINGEWTGVKFKANLRIVSDIPRCPNGHVLYQTEGLQLGWIYNNEKIS